MRSRMAGDMLRFLVGMGVAMVVRLESVAVQAKNHDRHEAERATSRVSQAQNLNNMYTFFEG